MNVLMQRSKYGRKSVQIPDGLKELMSDISREVIREQPENMEEFIANYLESVVRTREKIDAATKTVDEVLDACVNIKEILKKTGLSLAQAKLAAEIIANAFDEHVAKWQDPEEKTVTLKEVEVVVKLIDKVGLTLTQARKTTQVMQAMYKEFYLKNVKKLVIPDVSPDEALDKKHWSILECAKELQGTTLNNECQIRKMPYWMQPKFGKREEAATVIQAAYRGQKTRASFRTLKEDCEFRKMPFWQHPKFSRREKAAIVFQKTYRGKMARDDFKKKKEAATKIQSTFKGFRIRKKREEAEMAVTVIQNCFRKFMNSKRVSFTSERPSFIDPSNMSSFCGM